MPDLVDMTIADTLRQLRKRTGLSQQQMADRIGASRAAVARWESGTAVPGPAQTSLISSWYFDKEAPSSDATIFASKGLGLRGVEEDSPSVELMPHVGAPILKRIADGDFLISAGGADVSTILRDHAEPARAATTPPNSGVSAGKNSYTYDAHTYHTKVPPQGIAELLKHYLPDGGLVLDPFAGSGMTGVAASAVGMDCILNELSPAASFISSRFTSQINAPDFAGAIQAVLEATSHVRKSLYTTDCRECGKKTELLYTVWAYRVECYECHAEFQLWDHCRKYGRTVKEHRILTEFSCPSCNSVIKKSKLPRTVAEPVEIGYKCCGSKAKEVNHPPSSSDLDLLRTIELDPPMGELGAPTDVLPDGVNLAQPKRHGLTSVDKFYTHRNLAAMSQLWTAIHRLPDPQIAAQVAFAFTGLYRRVTKFSEFRFWGGSGNSARLNVPYIYDEANVFVAFERKARTIEDHLRTTAERFAGRTTTRIGSATDLTILPDESVDLVFTDPPFGANINYSEMNLLWESWLGQKTDSREEAIVNRVQGKDAEAYGDLMGAAFSEAYRVLRPDSWMLVVFMNSSAKIWNELNDAIADAGFLVVSADVFDKQHGTFKHFVSANTPGADLVLHCLKPGNVKHRSNADAVESDLESFLSSVAAENYRQSFLHVRRAEETDFRKLYSDWLSLAIVNGTPVMDFSEFRGVVAKAWGIPL